MLHFLMPSRGFAATGCLTQATSSNLDKTLFVALSATTPARIGFIWARHINFVPTSQQTRCVVITKADCCCLLWEAHTGCPRRNGQNFGRVFLMFNYTDITQNTYIQSWTVTEIMAIEKCGLLGCPRTYYTPSVTPYSYSAHARQRDTAS